MPDDYVRHLFYPDNKNRKYTIFAYYLITIGIYIYYYGKNRQP